MARQPYNIVLAGNYRVGKTAIFRHLSKTRAAETLRDPTLTGISSRNKDKWTHQTRCGDGTAVKVTLWDTAGLEKEGPRNLTKSYFSHSIGVILVFNKGNIATFFQLREWINQAQTHCARDNILFFLWCNDRGDTDNLVSDEAIRDFISNCAELSPELVFRISARRMEDTEYCTGVNESYQKVIEVIHRENRRPVSPSAFGSSYSDKTSLHRSDSGAFTGPSLQSIEEPGATDSKTVLLSDQNDGEQETSSLCPKCSLI